MSFSETSIPSIIKSQAIQLYLLINEISDCEEGDEEKADGRDI